MYAKKIILIVLSVLILLGCSSLKVNVDYDPEFKFLDQKSFAIVHHNREGEDTLFNDRFIKALESDLKEKAYIQADKNSAHLIFVFHVNVESKVDIDTDYTMAGYGRYAYGGPMVSTTRTYKYTKGTLIIDALNPKDNKIVWRVITTDILKSYDNPTERTVYIQKVVHEAMKNFPSHSKIK